MLSPGYPWVFQKNQANSVRPFGHLYIYIYERRALLYRDMLFQADPNATEHWNPTRHTVPLPTNAFGCIDFQGRHIVCTVHCILYTVYCILYTVHCILYTVYCTLYTLHCVLYTVYCTLYTLHCILYTVYCILHTVYCTLISVFKSCKFFANFLRFSQFLYRYLPPVSDSAM